MRATPNTAAREGVANRTAEADGEVDTLLAEKIAEMKTALWAATRIVLETEAELMAARSGQSSVRELFHIGYERMSSASAEFGKVLEGCLKLKYRYRNR